MNYLLHNDDFPNALDIYTGCPTRYRALHFFNNSNTNENIAKISEQE